MATHRPAQATDSGWVKSLRENWASEFCAEHDGTVPDFTKLDMRLTCLSDFEDLRVPRKKNFARIGRIAGTVVGGMAVVCPISYAMAPGLAAWLGSLGLLGTASTGTAISSLSGAALTSASLAAIGPGGVTGGTILITATGTALGGRQSASIAGNYFGAVQDFRIKKCRDGHGPALIFINGFLSQKNQDASDWLDATSSQFPSNPAYLVTWESSSMEYFGKLAAQEAGTKALEVFVRKLVQRKNMHSYSPKHPYHWFGLIAQLLGNKWHGSMVKAQMTGLILADLIARTDHEDGFILFGHSLGVRVIHSALAALSTVDESKIHDVYLLGGAVDGTQNDTWGELGRSASGSIFNVFSKNDKVLSMLYRTANAFVSEPIGIHSIQTSARNIYNFDATSIVDGHMKHKQMFGQVLDRISNTHFLVRE